MSELPMRIAGEGQRALPRKLNFTVQTLEGLSCPAGRGRLWVYDAKTPGLAFQVTEKGARAFYVYRKVNGRPQRMKLGGFPHISIDNARTMALKALGQIAAGVDPMEERRAIRRSMTLDELFEAYKERKKGEASARTMVTDESRFKTCFADWKTRKLTSIREADVRAKHAEIGKERGHVTANRAIQLLRRLLNFARIEPNPANKHAVDFFRERSRERFVGADELPKLIVVLDAQEPIFRDFFKLALWTGARRANLQAMRWGEIDMNASTWSIPGDKAKAHEPIVVHLAEPAVVILKERLKLREDPQNPWVFPTHAECGHLMEPKSAWKRILKAAGISDLRIHDLRRTLGSWQAAAGASLAVIGKSLGHRNPSTTAIYARLQLDPVRESVNAATSAMLKTVEAAKRKAKRKGEGNVGGNEKKSK